MNDRLTVIVGKCSAANLEISSIYGGGSNQGIGGSTFSLFIDIVYSLLV